MPKQPKSKDSDVEVLKLQLARALADYDNLVKRTEAEKAVWMSFAKKDLLVKFLPAVDSLEVAQAHLKDPGLDLVLVEIKKVFEAEGIVEIDTKGEFDANLHEVVEVVSGGKKNLIAEVAQKGYKFIDGEVIRHAKVKVYK
jgi:molecular chaperone GrpE (heat shock protein)